MGGTLLEGGVNKAQIREGGLEWSSHGDVNEAITRLIDRRMVNDDA